MTIKKLFKSAYRSAFSLLIFKHKKWLFHCYYELIINPFTPKISLVILITVCHIILVILIGKFGNEFTNNPLLMLLFILITCLLDIVLILWGEILSWSFKGVKRFITLKSKISSMLLNVIKKPHKVVTNNEGNNTSTNLQRKELKISWLHGSLYICDVNYITEVIIYTHHIHVQKCFWLIVPHEGNTIYLTCFTKR